MSQWNHLKLEIGIVDSLLRQWNGFEDIFILIFSKILLNFAIVLLANEVFQVLQIGYLTSET